MADYRLPAIGGFKKFKKKQVQLIASGDLRTSANQVCWPAQKAMEEALTRAISSCGYELLRAHPYNESREYVGDSHGIQQLIGYFWGYDDLEERPREVSFDGRYGADAFQALDQEVVRLAHQWLGEHGA